MPTLRAAQIGVVHAPAERPWQGLPRCPPAPPNRARGHNFDVFSSATRSFLVGTVGTNSKNARKLLSRLKNSVPSGTGDKPIFSGDTGDKLVYYGLLRSQTRLIGRTSPPHRTVWRTFPVMPRWRFDVVRITRVRRGSERTRDGGSGSVGQVHRVLACP